MKVKQLTVGPILGGAGFGGSTRRTTCDIRVFGRAQMEMTDDGPRRMFGVAQIRTMKGRFGSVRFFKMNPNFDMTGVVVFENLKANTEYEYRVGYIVTDAEFDHLDDDNVEWTGQESVQQFKTPSNDSAATRTMVFGSCRYLLKLFGGNWFDDRGDKTFRSINNQINDGKNVDHFLMVGDQIYADDLNRLLADQDVDEYLKRYREVFSRPHIRELMSRVPTYMTLDDHEIEDNWPENADRSDLVRKYPAAMHAYGIYQASHSPILKVDGSRIVGMMDHYWYTFRDGCCEYFVMDTRTERNPDKANRKIISDEQMDAVKDWLSDGSDRVKVIVSAVPFFPDMTNHSDDKWSGYTAQRDEIIEHIDNLNRDRILFLSGDVHASLSAELVAGNTKIISVISSAFFWPYPHPAPRNFKLTGDLTTVNGKKFRIRNASQVQATDNFTRLTISQSQVRVEVFGRKGDAIGVRKIHRF